MPGKGLDVTPGASYLIEVERQGAGFAISRAAILGGYEHHPGESAQVASKSRLAESTRDTKGSFRKHALYASMPSHEMMLKITDLASTSPSAISAITRMEVADATGQDSGFLHGHQVFSNDYASGPQALISMARESMVEHYASAMSEANLRIDACVAPAIALYHCYLVSGDFETRGVQMLAHIGETSTDFIFVDGGDLLAAKSINSGVVDIVKAISSGLGVNTEQGRQMVLNSINIRPGASAENPSGEGVVRHAQDAVSRLFLQLRASEGYLKAVTGKFGLKIGRLALCGPGAIIGGLPEFIAHRYQKQVTVFNPLAGFDFGDMGGNDRALVGQHGIALGVALGLAKIAADDGRNAATLVPPSVTARRTFMERSIWLYASVMVLVFCLAFSLIFSEKQASNARLVKAESSLLESKYREKHERVEPQNDNSGQTVLTRFNDLSELKQDQLTVEQQLREMSSAAAASTAARRLLANLPGLLLAGMEIEVFDLQYEEKDNFFQPVLLLTLRTNDSSSADASIEAMKAKFRRESGVALVSSSGAKESLDRSAAILNFRIYFVRAAQTIVGDDAEEAKPEGGA